MQYFFASVLLVFSVMAFYYSTRTFFITNKQSKENIYFSLIALSSGVWNLGFGLLYLQTDAELAYRCRSLGLLGVFLYLIFSLKLVSHISELSKKVRLLEDIFSLSGLGLFVALIQKNQAVYYMSDMGMTYSFNKTLPNNLYTVYAVIMSIIIFIISIKMLGSNKPKKINRFGKYLIIEIVLMTVGMVLDTVFPLFGLKVIPGSSIMQYSGILFLYRAILANNSCQVNEKNMSEYIYNSLELPIIIFDTDYKLTIANGAARNFLYIQDYEVNMGKWCIHDLFNVSNEIFEHEGQSYNISAICKAREINCDLAISKIYDPFGDLMGYIIAVKDMSGHYANIKEIEKAKQAADMASSSKTTFLANMSHEIRTPMNAIIGFSELALQEEINPAAKEYILDIQSASNTLLAIINEILDISKIEAGKMELICSNYYPASVFRDVYLIIQSQAEKKGLSFEMNIDPRLPSVLYGDKTRIREILINLLNNAVKYTKKGSVKLNVMVLENNADGLDVQFSVSDTGVGIREEDLDAIFESFSRADLRKNQNIEGTGLGLAITRGYLDLMGGELKVNSEYGRGSIFRAIIPQKIVDSTPIDMTKIKPDESVKQYSLGKLKFKNTNILVVDDNEINRKVVMKGLGHYGIAIDTASSGREAIEMCGKKNYHIVFMDQMMPEMDGVEAMHIIREKYEHYESSGNGKIVALTANSVSGVKDNLLSIGFNDYLGKPINYRRMEEVLLELLPKECIATDE